MIVSQDEFEYAMQMCEREPMLSLDTETTGLHPYHGDRLFSIIIGTKNDSFYFNFQPYANVDPSLVLPRELIRVMAERLFQDPTRLLVLQNAKFDCHMLAVEGAEIKSPIHDTEIAARLIYNKHGSYSLENLASRIGYKKDDAVAKYIEEHDLYEKYTIGLKEDKKPCYHKVPFEIISSYGLQDGRVTYDIAVWQLAELARDAETSDGPNPIKTAYGVEKVFTTVLLRLERRGMRVDVPYAKEAYAYEMERVAKYEKEFLALTGAEFVDSAKHLGPILRAAGDEIGVTEAGRDSVSKYVLEACKSPVAALILDHRDASKRANTYWGNIISYSDKDGFLRPDFRQSEAITYRTSCRSPNMQNVPKEDEDRTDDSPFPVKRGIIVPDDMALIEMDFRAQEFRLIVDYAREEDLAYQIEHGYDPHQATADMTGLTRKNAKTLNFALIYGIGKEKLAAKLGVTPDEAALMKARYFAKLPGVKNFIWRARQAAKDRGWVYNWAGARLYFPDPQESYKAPNAIIQGGCAHITKKAMGDVQQVLDAFWAKSYMIGQVHDSVLFYVDPAEMHLVGNIQEAMRRAYPHKILPMDVDTKISRKNWHEMEKFNA